MRADILLADSAQSVNGKAYLLGAGWSVQQGPGPLAVVIFIEVGWDETDRRIPWQLTLEDADGSIVNLPGPAGPQPFQISGEIEAGRAPGAPVGSPLTLPPLTVNLGPLSIEPGRYQFRLSLDGRSEETWYRAFTRTAPPTAGLAPPTTPG